MKPGLIEVFAYQETLLIMAVFGIAILAMVWFGFRRWLQSKERMDRLLSEQAAEQTAVLRSHGARRSALEYDRAERIRWRLPDRPADRKVR